MTHWWWCEKLTMKDVVWGTCALRIPCCLILSNWKVYAVTPSADPYAPWFRWIATEGFIRCHRSFKLRGGQEMLSVFVIRWAVEAPFIFRFSFCECPYWWPSTSCAPEVTAFKDCWVKIRDVCGYSRMAQKLPSPWFDRMLAGSASVSFEWVDGPNWLRSKLDPFHLLLKWMAEGICIIRNGISISVLYYVAVCAQTIICCLFWLGKSLQIYYNCQCQHSSPMDCWMGLSKPLDFSSHFHQN